MSVQTVLDKLSAHNNGVLGCVATHGEQVHSNLPERYELIDTVAMTERVSLMFQASDELETEHDPFDQVFLEYSSHAVYARRLDDGVLILLTEPMERAQFKKAQVGVNLFLKPLKKALSEAPEVPLVAEAAPEPTEKPKSMIGRIYRGVRY